MKYVGYALNILGVLMLLYVNMVQANIIQNQKTLIRQMVQNPACMVDAPKPPPAISTN